MSPGVGTIRFVIMHPAPAEGVILHDHGGGARAAGRIVDIHLSAVSERGRSRGGAPIQSVGMDNVIPLHRRVVPEPEPLWREAVGEALREERAHRGERIADVAGRAGVSPQYLSELERGRKDPSSEVLSAVSGALELSVLTLTRRAGQRLSGRVHGPVCAAA